MPSNHQPKVLPPTQPRDLLASEPIRSPRVSSEVLVLVSLALAVLAFLIHETYSLDIWWQAAVGKEILAKGRLPRFDHWLVAAEGGKYHDAHWLFQILVAGLERLGGMAAVQVVTITFWASTLALVYRSSRRWVSASWAAILVFISAMACVERFLPRPELFTYLGVAAFAYLLQQGRFRTWPERAFFAIASVAWTAGHGLFVLGPFLIGCYWVWAWTLRVRGRTNDLKDLSILLAIVLAGSLVTPYGLDPWRYALLMVSQVGGTWAPGLFDELGELSPTFGTAARSAPAFWFFLTLLIVFGALATWMLFRNRDNLSPRILIVLGLLVASMTGRRNVVLFALVAAPWIAEALGGMGSFRARARPIWSIAAAILMLAWSWYPLSGRYYLAMEIPARFGWGITPSFFPHALPAFLDRIDYRGKVLSSATIGGFYRYHGRRPLLDGCWVTVEPRTLDWLHRSTRDPRAWRQVMERFDLDALLLHHTSGEAAAILPELRRSVGWRLVYYDAAASFWLPTDHPIDQPMVDLRDPETLPAIRRPDDGFMLAAFLSQMNADSLLEIVLKETLSFGRRETLLLGQLGRLQLGLGDYPGAEASFRRLAALRDDASALNELAFLAYRRGNTEEARKLLTRALDLEPDNERFRQNLQRLGDP